MNPQEQCVPVHFLHDSNLPHNFGFLGSTFWKFKVLFVFRAVIHRQQPIKRANAADEIVVPSLAGGVVHVALERRAAERVSLPPIYEIDELHALLPVFKCFGMPHRRLYAFQLLLIRFRQLSQRSAFRFADISSATRRGRVSRNHRLLQQFVVFFSQSRIAAHHALCISPPRITRFAHLLPPHFLFWAFFFLARFAFSRLLLALASFLQSSLQNLAGPLPINFLPQKAHIFSTAGFGSCTLAGGLNIPGGSASINRH